MAAAEAASSSTSHIIRVPRTDEEGSFVLGEVTPSGTSKPLNVKFVATEGDEAYVVKLRHDRIGELRATNSPCSPEEWETILKSFLLRGEPVEGIEAGAEATLKKKLVITIRRRVAGINQRLGALTLSWKDDEAIELFDWCGAIAQERGKLKTQALTQIATISDLKSRIADLQKELEELAEAKKEREAELLEKFCDLLNEKKVKIREQQKLLSSANVDSSRLPSTAAKVAQLSVHSSQDEGRKPAVSSRARTATKRKAPPKDASSDSDDDEFEKAPTAATDKMDVDEPPPRQGQPSPQALPEEDRVTSEDEDATGSEPDETMDEPAPSPPPTRRKLATRSEKAAADEEKEREVPMQTTHNLRNRSPGSKAHASAPPPADGSESGTDDEL